MPRQEIRVTFDPATTRKSPFSFSPERTVLQGATSVVDVILQTMGAADSAARFAQPEAILWKTEGPDDLQEEVHPGRTSITLRGFPMNPEQAEVDYGYFVQVEYEGAVFSSFADYPTMSCVQTGGGG